MRQGIYALGGSILLLLVGCSDGNVKIVDCQKNFTSECERELDNSDVRSNPILRASFAAVGCAQDNLKACSTFEMVTSQSRTQFNRKNKATTLEDFINDPILLFDRQHDDTSSIDQNFCDIQSSDYEECVNFIDSLKGFVAGLATTKIFDNSLSEQKDISGEELNCSQGNLLDCDNNTLSQQLTQNPSQQNQIVNNAIESKFTEVCSFNDGNDSGCRGYSDFSPQDFEKLSGDAMELGRSLLVENSPVSVFADAVCHQDKFCTTVIKNSIKDNLELANNAKVVNRQEENPVNSQLPLMSIGNQKGSQQGINHQVSDDVNPSQVFANAVCDGDQFCSTIFGNAILNNLKSDSQIDINRQKESLDDVNGNDGRVQNRERTLDSSQVENSRYRNLELDSKQTQVLLPQKISPVSDISSPQLVNFLQMMDANSDTFQSKSDFENLNLYSDLNAVIINPQGLSSEKIEADNHLGDDLMQNKLNENFRILSTYINEGRKTAINEARVKQKEWQEQQQRMQLLEAGRQQGQAEEISRMQDKASEDMQTFLVAITQGQEKSLAEKAQLQQQLLEQHHLNDEIEEQRSVLLNKKDIVQYPLVVKMLKDDCDVDHNVQACYQLANIFDAGKRVLQDRAQARVIYNNICNIAQKGNIEGQYYCARLNIEGKIVEPDLEQAIQLLEQSCQKAFMPSCQNLEMLKQIKVNATTHD